MYRRYRERRYHRRRREDYNRPGRSFTSAFRHPRTQIAFLAVVTLVIVLLLLVGSRKNDSTPASLASEIPVSEAFTKYQNGALLLDVRTAEEWNQFHVPNTMLIPLDQLPARVNELPRDREIVVVCRPDTCSPQGREILLHAGFTQVTTMKGGLDEWRASGYPVEP